MSKPEKCCYSSKNQSRAVIAGLIFAGLIPTPPATAQVVPTPECIFVWSDTAELNRQPVAAGTVIRAYDPAGILCGETVVSHEGAFGLMPVYRDDPLTPAVDEGAEPGDALVFTIDDAVATCGGIDTPEWTYNGDTRKIDLAAERVFPTSRWISVWGSATGTGGVPLPGGAVVVIRDPDGVLCGSFAIEHAGRYGLAPVYADDPQTPGFDEGAEPGDRIRFEVDGESWAGQGPETPVWTFNGDVKNVDIAPAGVPVFLKWSEVLFEQNRIRISWQTRDPVRPSRCRLLRYVGDETVAEPVNTVVTRDSRVFVALDRDLSPDTRYRYLLQTDDVSVDLGSAFVPAASKVICSVAPNPFSHRTTFLFDVEEPSRVSLQIFDVRGRLVRNLLDGETYFRGSFELRWDGMDESGETVAQGAYFAAFTAGKNRTTVKINVVR